MPLADASRWDARYREEERYASFDQARPFLLDHLALLPQHGLALDVAMGLGGNAGLLLAHGLRVIGIDISMTALRHARRKHPSLSAVQADLPAFYLPPDSFDVILNFFFLQHDLWPQYVRALRPGGLLVMETLTQDMLAVKTDIDPQYLLAPGELHQAFPTLETLVYREGWVSPEGRQPRAVASLIARRPII